MLLALVVVDDVDDVVGGVVVIVVAVFGSNRPSYSTASVHSVVRAMIVHSTAVIYPQISWPQTDRETEKTPPGVHI